MTDDKTAKTVCSECGEEIIAGVGRYYHPASNQVLCLLYCGRLGMQVCVPATAAGAIPDDKKPERMSDEQFEELRLIPPDYCEADCARVAEVALIGGVPRARHLRPELERKHDNRRNPQKRLAPRNSGLLRRKPLKSLRTGETTGPALKTQGRGVERA